MEKICSNRQTFTNNEVETGRERLLEIMNFYKDVEVLNFKETLFFPDFSGSYPIHSPDVINIQTGNTNKRLTMGCFISASGELLLPTFIDVHLNQSSADLKVE